MEALNELAKYNFIEVVNIFFLAVTLVVVVVRAVEKGIKKGYSYFIYLYKKKRGKEVEEETFSNSIKKINKLSVDIKQIEEQQKNNVEMFTNHELDIMDRLDKISDDVNKLASLIKEREKREVTQRQNELIIIESVNAAIALGEATARAVQRIPDAKCNGDMRAALDYATGIKHKHKEFITKQGVESMY